MKLTAGKILAIKHALQAYDSGVAFDTLEELENACKASQDDRLQD